MSDIAEGFERGATSEFIQFLFIAKGSCGQVRARLRIARDQNYMSEADYVRLHNLSQQTGGMISSFIAHLQRSPSPGGKFTRPKRHVSRAKAADVRPAPDSDVLP